MQTHFVLLCLASSYFSDHVFSQVDGFRNPTSNNLSAIVPACPPHVSVPHFGNSCNISNVFIFIIFVMVIMKNICIQCLKINHMNTQHYFVPSHHQTYEVYSKLFCIGSVHLDLSFRLHFFLVPNGFIYYKTWAVPNDADIQAVQT